MENHGAQAHRAAQEIWQWRQTHGFVSDRSVKILEEIIERHTAAGKARALVKEILQGSASPSDEHWNLIRRIAEELSDVLDQDQSREYEAYF